MERLSEIFSLPLVNNVALLSLILAIILIIPLFTKRFRIPQVIGLIVCGTIIGPHALNIVDNQGAISLFSTIGLLYIMFTAGLELDIHQFNDNKQRSIIFALLTMLCPIAVIFPIAYFGFDMPALAAILTGCMFSTHTLIAYPAVSRYGVSNDASVAVSIGGTIIVDAVVLILLAVLIGLAVGNLTPGFWIGLGISLVIFSAFMFFAVPAIARWFFSHWHNERIQRYIFIIFMLMISALVAEICELEGIVGAFLAGLMLNRYIPKTSSLMHQIEFVGNVLFIPIFMVSVGMLVDISVIAQGPATILLAVLLSVAALAAKWLAAWICQKLFGYSEAQRKVMFGLSSARVAATLAIVLVAHRAGILNDTFLNAAILLILITCIVASFVTESAAKSLAIEHADRAQHHDPAADEHILLPVANPAHAMPLLDFASHIKSPASKHPATLFTVVADDAQSEPRIKEFRNAASKVIKESDNPDKFHISATIDPSFSDAVSRVAREKHANILLMGWPQSSLPDKIFGEKWRALVREVDRMMIWADIPKALTTPKRIALFTLKYAENEPGFDEWFDKVIQLASQTALEILHFGTAETHDAMNARLAATHKNASMTRHEPEDSSAIREKLQPDDWIIAVSARINTVSHISHCESFPATLARDFAEHNKLLIYPYQPVDIKTDPEADEFEMV